VTVTFETLEAVASEAKPDGPLSLVPLEDEVDFNIAAFEHEILEKEKPNTESEFWRKLKAPLIFCQMFHIFVVILW